MREPRVRNVFLEGYTESDVAGDCDVFDENYVCIALRPSKMDDQGNIIRFTTWFYVSSDEISII